MSEEKTAETSTTYDEVFLRTDEETEVAPRDFEDWQEKDVLHRTAMEDVPHDPSTMREEAKNDPLEELDLEHISDSYRTNMRKIFTNYKILYNGTLREFVDTEPVIDVTYKEKQY